MNQITSRRHEKLLPFLSNLLLYVGHNTLFCLEIGPHLKNLGFVAVYQLSELVIIFDNELALHQHIAGQLFIDFDDPKKRFLQIYVLLCELFQYNLNGIGRVTDQL